MLNEGYLDKVYYRFWLEDNEVANVFAIHGLGGHCTWFDNAARLFNINKINFFSFDLPGFGQSKYSKGIIDTYKTWIDVTRKVLERFLVSFSISKPVFILGHSMGALISILLTRIVKVNGWILSVPSFEGNPKTWPFLNFFLPVLFKSFFSPQEEILLPFGPELITKNKETQLKVKEDKYRVFNLNAVVYKHVYFLTLKAKSNCKLINQPVLMLQAGRDLVCLNKAMDEYYDVIKSTDKSKKIYTNSYHDLFIEDEINQIVDDSSKWIKMRC